MMVTADRTEGTIGGGELEFRATALARDLLVRDAPELSRTFSLGPELGQCCGGAVTLRFTRNKCLTEMPGLHVHQMEANRVAKPLVGRAVFGIFRSKTWVMSRDMFSQIFVGTRSNFVNYSSHFGTLPEKGCLPLLYRLQPKSKQMHMSQGG